jgi:stringent starvation protein B
MNSSKPYLVQALFEWILDNNCTPHIVVNAVAPGVSVPEQYVNKNGEIVLNISPSAVEQLDLGRESISFMARFSGVSQDIFVPVGAVLGIYARENGRGMMFEVESEPEPDPNEPKPEPPQPNSPDSGTKRPSLRVVK